MKVIRLFAATMAICTLAACGGGGGSSVTFTPAPPPASKTIVSGIATKGPFLKDSVVNVYAVTNGVKGALITSTKTSDDNGTYSADLGSYTGPVIVEVSGSYQDEATGNTVTVGAGAPIRAALGNAQGTVTLPVTPLTELAVQKATSLAPAAITAANTLVSGLFKVDIVGTMPVAPTAAAVSGASQAQKDYTLALAAVSQLASGQSGATDADKLKGALDTLSQGITSTGMSSSACTAFRDALTNFVANPKNQTGVNDAAGTGLTTVGTVPKSYTLSLNGTGKAYGIQFDLALPTGVTVNYNSQDSTVTGSSFGMMSGGPSDALTATRYSGSGAMTVGIVTVAGMNTGAFATVTCNVASGEAAPSASAFAVNNLRVFDTNGNALTGFTVTVQ
jgi:hypothetical protein